MATIRVVLAEGNVLLREGLDRLIAASEDLEVAGTAGDLPQLPRQSRHRPDHRRA